MPGFIHRDNRVPHFQRLYQRDDGVRIWKKSPRSNYFLYPYYVILWGGFAGSMYMMTRMLFGHKTMWGKG